MALCSLSTRIVSVSTLPSDTNLVNDSMIPVDGVMGYAGITSGFSWRNASATAWLPVTATVFILVIVAMLFALLFHDNGLVALLARAFHGANAAALAVVVIEADHFLVFHPDRGVRAVDPAEQALDAVLLDPPGLERTP